MRPSRRWLAILVAGLGLALIGGVVASHAGMTSTAEPPPGWSAQEWAELDSAKQAYFEDVAAGMQTDDPLAATAPDPGPLGPDEDLLRQEAAEPSEPPLGLTEGGADSFLGRGYAFENYWGEMNDGRLTQSWAGSRARDSAHGLIVIISWDWDTESPDPNEAVEYEAPAGVGRLRITGVADGLISFASETGDTGTFDLSTGEYSLED